uniref:G-protein coupled receptors family 1 profile domain-containing protein n=1 Tax=Ciona savignyi TaxID=51511 RepID=H2YQ53_CIOSA
LVVSKKQVCNGVADCYDLSDECLCHNQTTCNNIMSASFESCSYGSMLCNGTATLCDGNQECSDYIDELNCTTRHYCIAGTSISIPMDKVCDGHLDCNDGSDESRALCVSRHYCVSGDPLSVAPEMIEDGFEDCSDGSDECPRNSNRTMVFSSQYEMINNPVLRVLFWIMGLIAFGGNLFVIVTTVIDMQKPGSIVPIKQSCNWFILNLSIFDFIFSVYLLIIAIKGAQFSGKYCFYDLQWRTSSLCSFLGTLMMISTQGSAFMMTVITTFRLLFVFMPFKSNTIDFKWSIGSTTVVWLIAIVLSIVPSLSRFSGYFSTSVWFPNYFYRELTLKKVDLFNMAQRINRSIPFVGNWQDAKNKVEDTFQSLSIRGEFGYYSENSVCMPDLFSKKGFNAWQFSCFIITFNFLLFLYVVASYVIIYRRSTQMKAKKAGSNFILQARITRLILTDFACWIPICILAYLSFAGVQLQPIVYVISAGVLLPINSALNPIIYSSAISDLASKVI